ncbi:MAG: mechanosensitive ion channel family protein [Butyrivibrio sp.]|nr:mechanosensitive ion channel family protein [Butyrivibrio sp.]
MEAKEALKVLNFFLKHILPFIVAYALNLYANKYISIKMLRGKVYLVFFKNIVLAFIWLLAAAVALLGIPDFNSLEVLLTSSGVVAVVFGLGAQSTLANVFAGISISAPRSRPFDIGDRIKIDSIDPGYVENITLRHTVIKTYQNEIIYVPNSVVGSASIINYTQEESFSYPIIVSVAYGTDMEKAMKIMADVIVAHPKHYGGRPQVLCKSCDESGVTLRALVETRDFKDNPSTCSECLVELMKRFAEEGIEIPYNKLVVYKGDKKED